MPRKPRNTNNTNRFNWNQIQWVINNLPQKDLDVIEKEALSVSKCLDMIDEYVDSGGEIKLNFSDYADCFELKLMFYEKGFTNSGYAVSARGENFVHCMRILIYKVENVAKGDLSTLYEARETNPKYG